MNFKHILSVSDESIVDFSKMEKIKNGVRSKMFFSNSSELTVTAECKGLYPVTMRVGYIKENGEMSFEGITEKTVLSTDGFLKFYKTFDASNLAVYYDASEFFIQFEGEDFEILDGRVWELSEFEKLSIYDRSFESVMCKIEEKLNRLNRISAENYENIAVSPNGTKFVINVDNEGNVYTAPVIPKKVLFMGNSLLLGMEGFYGMCSSSPKHDYYYHVTEAIKEKNSDAEFFKIHGADYEMLENERDFDELWNVKPNIYTGKPMKESFTEDLDLIIIQLGTNTNNEKRCQTLEKTFDKFISEIKKCSPCARIIWVHGWGSEASSGKIIADGCGRWRIGHISIADIHTKENQGQLMQKYDLLNGKKEFVNELWIDHPGDLGMKRIADRIVNFIKI